jgi:EmrB/QacA subfamily drug resistance transporter
MTHLVSGRDVTVDSQPAGELGPRRWLVLAVLAAGTFMAQLDISIVSIAVPAIAHSFSGASLASMSWILTGYAITFATLLVPAGRLADHFGRRRVLLAGIVLFTVASAVCASAPVLWVAVAGRVLQGVGAAMMVPTSLGLLWPVFPRREHNLVVGIWAGVAAVAASLGPPVGGLLVGVDWRWIFLINLPIGVLTVVAGALVLPEIRPPGGSGSPDLMSAAALLSAVFLLTLVTVEGSRWGWMSGSTAVVLVVGVLAAVATVWRVVTHPRAIIEASLFKVRPFAVSSVGLFFFFLSFSAWWLMNVLFLQGMWHYSPVRCGLAVAPAPITAAVFAISSGRVADLIGRRATATIGCVAFAAAGAFLYAFASPSPAYLMGYLPASILGGIGSGFTRAPLFAAASALPDHRATTGSAVLNMSREIGSAFGVAILVVLLSDHPGSVGAYRHGWLFVAVCSAIAAGVVFFGNRAGTTTDTALVGDLSVEAEELQVGG